MTRARTVAGAGGTHPPDDDVVRAQDPPGNDVPPDQHRTADNGTARDDLGQTGLEQTNSAQTRPGAIDTENTPPSRPGPARPGSQDATAPARNTGASRYGRGRRRGAEGRWLLLGVVALVASVIVAMRIGPASVSTAEILTSGYHHLAEGVRGLGIPVPEGTNPLSASRDAIIWQGRAPRLITAACVGAGLALCGVVMQGLTRNPLADPYLLGVSSGAALGAVAVLLLGVAIWLPLAAFAGALVALGATLAMAGFGGALTPARTILAGIAVAQACSALVSFAIFSTARGDSYREILGWLLGSLARASWSSVLISGIALVVIGAVLLGAGRSLDAFAFGDVSAASLGVDVTRTRWVLLTLTALLTGAMVAVSGAIGFVGLVIPHIIRLALTGRHRWLLPLAAVVGAVFLLWADTAARVVFAPMEVPVGVFTAGIGAPVFAWLLMRQRTRSKAEL